MFILDTDIAIWILREHHEIISILKRMHIKEDSAMSALTVSELYMHIFPSEIPSVEDLIDNNQIIQVNKEIAKKGGLYWSEFHLKFAKLGIVDCIIAASVYAVKGTLITLNDRHFPMTDIKIFNPLKK
jgi:predicted nucleic acid-binding protein